MQRPAEYLDGVGNPFKNPGRGFGTADDMGVDDLRDARYDPRIDRELESGEELIWAGRHNGRGIVLKSMPVVLFGIPWTAFALFWTYMAAGGISNFSNSGSGGPPGIMKWVFPLWGLPFILIGFAMLSTPFWGKRKARRTLYALTDRRCIVWNPGFRGAMKVTSYGPDDLVSLSRQERRDGSGDVIFVKSMRIRERGSSSDTVTEAEGFIGVDEPKTLERLIRDTLLSEFEVPGETRY